MYKIKTTLFIFLIFKMAFSQPLLLSNTESPNEPAIAINPKNPKQIIVGSAIGQVFLSADGGKSFKRFSLDGEYGFWSDPSVFFDEMGSAYYFHLSGKLKGNSSDRIVCQRKLANDTSFKVINVVAYTSTNIACNERPIACYNPINKEIYLTYVVFDAYGSKNPKDSTRLYFTKSSDYGESWTSPIRLNKIAGDCSDMDKSVQGGTITYNKKGDLFVTWANNENIYFNKSSDSGKTWLKREIAISNQPGGWDYNVPGIKMPNGLPVIVADRSDNKKTAGNLYVFWADQRIKYNISNAYMSMSSDSGKTWIKAKRVTAIPFNTHQYHVWAGVDHTNGTIYVSYYQTEMDMKTHLVVAQSQNGGNKFNAYTLAEPEFLAEGEQYLGDMNQIAVLNNKIMVPIIKGINEKNELYFIKLDADNWVAK
jgi:hypothetical protein